MRVGGAVVLVVALVAGGCGGGETETVVERQTVIEKAPPETKPEAEAEPAPESEPKPEAESSGGGDITVPNVTGKDHQLAQDTMQAAGLYNLREEDATGQDRGC